LFPSDQYVNNYKSAHPLGQVGTATFTSTNGSKLGNCSFPGYTGVVFEPIDAYKGDFARACFYSATRYMDDMDNWLTGYPTTELRFIYDADSNNFKKWFVNMLLQWHHNDPVSTKEINRNNAVYYNTAQHNRNPFVDHPGYVDSIWAPLPSYLPEPTNNASNFSIPRSIQLTWTDTPGAHLPDGYLIRMDSIGFYHIATPVDGVPVTEDRFNKFVPYGTHEYWFSNLTPNIPYFFKMYPYIGSGGGINYKTDGVIPQVQKTTAQ
jgi:hypothetical protein